MLLSKKHSRCVLPSPPVVVAVVVVVVVVVVVAVGASVVGASAAGVPLAPCTSAASVTFVSLGAANDGEQRGALTQIVELVAPPPSGAAAAAAAAAAADDDDLLFAVQRTGRVWLLGAASSTSERRLVANDGDGSALFLDWQQRTYSSPSEAGLLSLAFAADFAVSGRFFVYVSERNSAGAHVSRVYEMRRAAERRRVADATSARVLLELSQPYSNHNAGQLVADHRDASLYVSLGDGGSAGDPLHAGQDLTTPLGKLLRLSVAEPADEREARTGSSLAPPHPDNPFVGDSDVDARVFAFGLRNAWRCSLDAAQHCPPARRAACAAAVSDRLFCGDVGQNRVEEIDVVRAGGNYGWREREGTSCYPSVDACTPLTVDVSVAPSRTSAADDDRARTPVTPLRAYVPPIFEYSHGVNSRRSVIAGHVYRGSALCDTCIDGAFVFGDLNGEVWALREDLDGGGVWQLHTIGSVPNGELWAFGRDAHGELYASNSVDVFRLAPSAPRTSACATPAVCGDGVVDDDEACDDANTDADDGCSPTCTVEPGWHCDAAADAAASPSPSPSQCAAVCGDGVRVRVAEECDKGADNSDDPNAACTTACRRQLGTHLLDAKHVRLLDSSCASFDRVTIASRRRRDALANASIAAAAGVRDAWIGVYRRRRRSLNAERLVNDAVAFGCVAEGCVDIGGSDNAVLRKKLKGRSLHAGPRAARLSKNSARLDTLTVCLVGAAPPAALVDAERSRWPVPSSLRRDTERTMPELYGDNVLVECEEVDCIGDVADVPQA